MDESTHLIWSNEHRGWRRPGGLGYSVHVEEAGRFTRQQALEKCLRALVGWRPGTPSMRTSMSRTKYVTTPLSFRRLVSVMRQHETASVPSWQAYQGCGKLRPSFRSSRTAPGVSLIFGSATEMRTVPRRTIPEIATARSTAPRRDYHNPPFLPRGTTAMGNGPWGTCTTKRTRHEAEPASSGRSLPRPSMRWTQQWIQTMMQIYASTARLRSSGAHSYIRHESHRVWRATATSGRFLADRRSEAPVRPKTDDLFLPVDTTL